MIQFTPIIMKLLSLVHQVNDLKTISANFDFGIIMSKFSKIIRQIIYSIK